MSNADRGQATVEFALVLPFLFLFSLSVIQVGSVANDQLALGHAARIAARAISLGDVTEQNAGEIVRNIVANEITLADVTVNVDLNESLARVQGRVNDHRDPTQYLASEQAIETSDPSSQAAMYLSRVQYVDGGFLREHDIHDD